MLLITRIVEKRASRLQVGEVLYDGGERRKLTRVVVNDTVDVAWDPKPSEDPEYARLSDVFANDELVQVVAVDEQEAPSNAPVFDHAALLQLWEAMQQYVDNHPAPEDAPANTDETTAPPLAAAVLAQLDAYVASHAG